MTNYFRCHNSKDILGKSLADLQAQFAEILAHSQRENKAAQARERELQKEMASQQARLEEAHEKYRLACNKAAEAKVRGLQITQRSDERSLFIFSIALGSVLKESEGYFAYMFGYMSKFGMTTFLWSSWIAEGLQSYTRSLFSMKCVKVSEVNYRAGYYICWIEKDGYFWL